MNIDKNQLMFGVTDPLSYYCTVWSQTVHHSELAIRITSTFDDTSQTQKFFWIFTGVYYYSGLLRWKNIDFVMDTQNQDPILKKIRKKETFTFGKSYNLFKFFDYSSDFEIKIIASGVFRVENLPQ